MSEKKVYAFYLTKSILGIKDIELIDILRKGSKPGVKSYSTTSFKVKVAATCVNEAWTEVLKVGITL